VFGIDDYSKGRYRGKRGEEKRQRVANYGGIQGENKTTKCENKSKIKERLRLTNSYVYKII